MNILLLASQHGDELLGELLFEYITKHRPQLLPRIEFMIANEEAHKRGIRYVESDMNRSYVQAPRTVEEQRAKEIHDYIIQKNFDLVLDLHTTRSDQPPCIIIKKRMAAHERFIAATSIENIVIMNHEIVNTSLIGVVNQAVSVEISDSQLGNKIYADISDDIERYIRAESSAIQQQTFEITGLLTKSEITLNQAKDLINFKESAQGFYPILVGETSYEKNTNYLGFKARRIPTVKGESRL